MPQIEFKLIDAIDKDGNNICQMDMTMDTGEDPNGDPTQAMLFGLAIKRIFENGTLARMMPSLMPDVIHFIDEPAEEQLDHETSDKMHEELNNGSS